jgi:hypothetical protein
MSTELQPLIQVSNNKADVESQKTSTESKRKWSRNMIIFWASPFVFSFILVLIAAHLPKTGCSSICQIVNVTEVTNATCLLIGNKYCMPENIRTSTMRTTCGPNPIQTTVSTWFGRGEKLIFDQNDYPPYKCYYDPAMKQYYEGNQPISFASYMLYVLAGSLCTVTLLLAFIGWLKSLE